VQDLLDLLDQTLLLVGTVGTVSTSTVLVSHGLSNGVVLGSALSTSQGAVTTGTIGVGLEVSVVIGVSALASSAGVGSELVVLGSELRVSMLWHMKDGMNTYESLEAAGTLPALGVLEVGVAVGSTVWVASSSGSVSVELVGVGSSTSSGSTGTGRLVLVGVLVKVTGLVEAGSSRSIRVSVMNLVVSNVDLEFEWGTYGRVFSAKVLVLGTSSTETGTWSWTNSVLVGLVGGREARLPISVDHKLSWVVTHFLGST
jgi:hypothetical protein